MRVLLASDSYLKGLRSNTSLNFDLVNKTQKMKVAFQKLKQNKTLCRF